MAPANKGSKSRVDVETIAQLRTELSALTHVLELTEDEHTWEKIEAAVQRFTLAIRGGACKFADEFVAAFKDKDMIKRITNCLITERTRLSGSTLDLMSSATRLGPSFQPLIQIYFPTILRLLARTNKLYITRTQSCISAIIHNTHLPHIMPYIAEGMSDKSATMRKGCAEAILEALSKNASGGMLIDKEAIERRGSLALIEEVIRKAAVDKEVKVREAGRQIWNVYKTEWSDRVDAFSAPLTPVMRKYLNLPAAGAAANGRMSPTKLFAKARPASPLKARSQAPAAKPMPRPPVKALSASVKENGPIKSARSSPVKRPESRHQRTKTQEQSRPASVVEKRQRTEVPSRPASVQEIRAPFTSILDDLFAPVSEAPSRPTLTSSISQFSLPSVVTPLCTPIEVPATAPSFGSAFNFLPTSQAEQQSLSPVQEASLPGPSRPATSRAASFKPRRAPGRAVTALSTSQTQPQLNSSTSSNTARPAPTRSTTNTKPTLKSSASKEDVKPAARAPISRPLQSRKEGLSSSSSGKVLATSTSAKTKTAVSASFKPKRPPASPVRAVSSASTGSTRETTAPSLPPMPSTFASMTFPPIPSAASPKKASVRPKLIQSKKTVSTTTKKATTGSFFDRGTVASDAKAREAREKRKKMEMKRKGMSKSESQVSLKEAEGQPEAVVEEMKEERQEIVQNQRVEEHVEVKLKTPKDPTRVPLPATEGEISLPSPYLKEETYSPIAQGTFSPITSPLADKQARIPPLAVSLEKGQQIFSFATSAQAFALPLDEVKETPAVPSFKKSPVAEAVKRYEELSRPNSAIKQLAIDPAQIPLPPSVAKPDLISHSSASTSIFDFSNQLSDSQPASFLSGLLDSPSKTSPNKRSFAKLASVGRI